VLFDRIKCGALQLSVLWDGGKWRGDAYGHMGVTLARRVIYTLNSPGKEFPTE
jgi:hypothetical protein